MKILYLPKFEKQYKGLPAKVKDLAEERENFPQKSIGFKVKNAQTSWQAE